MAAGSVYKGEKMKHHVNFNKEDKREIGKRIRQARESRGMSLQDLGEKTGLPNKTILKFEAGILSPSDAQFDAIAAAVGMTAREVLFGRDEAEVSPEPSPEPVETKNEDTAVPAGNSRNKYIKADKGLRDLRKQKGLTVGAAAERCGVPVSTLATWESGKSCIPFKRAEMLAKIYGVPMEKIGTPRADTFITVNGEAFRENRKRTKVTIRKLAETCGVSKGMIFQWESEKRRISLINAEKAAALFGVPASSITRASGEASAAPDKEPPKIKETPAPATATNAVSELPENLEERFCKNVLYHTSQKGITEDAFREAVGCDTGFFKETSEKGGKIELDVLLKAAGLLGKSIRELSCEDDLEEIMRQIAEKEEQLRELKRKIGA